MNNLIGTLAKARGSLPGDNAQMRLPSIQGSDKGPFESAGSRKRSNRGLQRTIEPPIKK